MQGVVKIPLPEDVPLEDSHNPFSEINELLKRWNNRLSIDNLRFSQRYIDNLLKIGMVFCRKGGSFHSEEYVAVLERELPVSRVNVERNGIVEFGQRCSRRKNFGEYRVCIGDHSDTGARRRHDEKQSVFVHDVEIVNTPQGVVSSLVRIEALHERDSLTGGTFQALRDIRLRELLRGAYWEFCVLGGRSVIMQNKSIDEKVQSGVNVMDAISGDGAPFQGEALPHSEAVNFVLGIRVYLSADEAGIVHEGRDFGFNISKVFFGPTDLYPNTDKKVMRHD